MSELHATTDPFHVRGGGRHGPLLACALLAMAGGCRSTNPPSGCAAMGGRAGAAAITWSAWSSLPARWSRRAVAVHLSRSNSTRPRSAWASAVASAAMRATASPACPKGAARSLCACGHWCKVVSGGAMSCNLCRHACDRITCMLGTVGGARCERHHTDGGNVLNHESRLGPCGRRGRDVEQRWGQHAATLHCTIMLMCWHARRNHGLAPMLPPRSWGVDRATRNT